MSARHRSYTDSPWRLRMAAGYVVVVALLALVWGFSIMGPLSSHVEGQQYDKLAAVARAAGVALEASDVDPDAVLARVATDDDVRVTLIDAEGRVLADSSETTSEMANHAARPEVVAALAGELGRDRRVSETDGIEYLYVAVPCTWANAGAALRVSEPITQARAALMAVRTTGFALLAAAVVAAGAIATFASSRLLRPMSRLERVRTDFVANASHELKTPVAGIRLLSDSIRQATEDGDLELVRTFAERLDLESRRLKSLVNDLMDLSRLEDGGRAASEGCDLGSIVDTSFDAHVARARARGIVLAARDETDGPMRVRLSSTDASLVVDNLLDNALNYTDEGSIDIRLYCVGGEAVLEVADTGIGIPVNEQERIFERFYRVDKARSRESGGTGLGLALVRNAVARGGGSVSLASEPGVGSTFTVRLPLAG